MKRYAWATAGDVNAFFGLMLDNVAVMVLMVSLLVGTYGLDANFALTYMIPGTALGVLVGDLAFCAMAFRLSRRTGRTDITAMPLGLDTPSTFGMVFFVIGPAFLAAREESGDPQVAAFYAWQIGICAMLVSGLFKLCCSLGSSWIRRVVPRAGLLGSLAAIALVLISFLPMLEIVHMPIVGFAALAVILTTLIARVRLPGNIPGALGALLVGLVIYYAMSWTGTLGHSADSFEAAAFEPRLGLLLPQVSLQWMNVLEDSLTYLPVVLPFALAAVVGGIDCTESAAAAGDEFDTRAVIGVDAMATLAAGFCGGMIQTTPYIGHPAYKAMGGRAAYTLATALFIGGAGMLGYFAYMYAIIPRPAVFPILIFIGLEITAQSYHATPSRHYPAVALACVPAMAYLIMIYVNNALGQLGKSIDDLDALLQAQLYSLRVLSAGFIVTSLLWASALATLIDRRLVAAACVFGVAAVFSLFGVIHSPYPDGSMLLPWRDLQLPEAMATLSPPRIALAYAAVAAILLAWSRVTPPSAEGGEEDL